MKAVFTQPHSLPQGINLQQISCFEESAQAALKKHHQCNINHRRVCCALLRSFYAQLSDESGSATWSQIGNKPQNSLTKLCTVLFIMCYQSLIINVYDSDRQQKNQSGSGEDEKTNRPILLQKDACGICMLSFSNRIERYQSGADMRYAVKMSLRGRNPEECRRAVKKTISRTSRESNPSENLQSFPWTMTFWYIFHKRKQWIRILKWIYCDMLIIVIH